MIQIWCFLRMRSSHWQHMDSTKLILSSSSTLRGTMINNPGVGLPSRRRTRSKESNHLSILFTRWAKPHSYKMWGHLANRIWISRTIGFSISSRTQRFSSRKKADRNCLILGIQRRRCRCGTYSRSRWDRTFQRCRCPSSLPSPWLRFSEFAKCWCSSKTS